jgi:hypothetical protein
LGLISLANEPVVVTKFISAQKLVEDKFILEFSNNDNKNKTNKIKKRRIELPIGYSLFY